MILRKATSVRTKQHRDRRLYAFAVFMLIGSAYITYALFFLTVTEHAEYAQSAKEQYASPSALLSGRGSIFLSDGQDGQKLAAHNQRTLYAYIDKRNTKLRLAEIAEKIAPLVGMTKDSLESVINESKKQYIIFARGLTAEQASAIEKSKINGVSTAAEVVRTYPYKTLASHVLGFVGFDGKQRAGQYGIEAYHDEALSGLGRTQSAAGNTTYSWLKNLFSFSDGEKPQENAVIKREGDDLVLTIDYTIQSYVEARLNALLKQWSSPAGTIIVQDPSTGSILAMASSPSYDPNRYSSYDWKTYVNPAIQRIFEPGSAFKSVTMAAALDVHAVTPQTTYTDPGTVIIDGYPINNFDRKSHGIQTMREVLEKSLNTGAMFVMERTGSDVFLNHAVAFGFGKKSQVDLSGELPGNISNLYSGRRINFATASFGQGIAVTPLQLIGAYSAIANDGKLMRPYVVKERIHPDGSVEKTKPQILDTPITPATAQQMKSMLVDVVDYGFDKARVSGYDIAGKTGTAQIPDERGGYLEDNQYIHDFLGFAPAYAPRFAILIKIDRPQGVGFASGSIPPAFSDIAKFLLRYFNIPPTRQ